MPRFLIVYLCACVGGWLPVNCAVAEWQAGVSRAKITPQTSMPMAGYASRGAEHATGTLTDLWAKALVLKSGDQEAAIITLDLIGIDNGLSHQITSALQKKFNWQRRQIAICTSHTHWSRSGEELAPDALFIAGRG